MAAVSSKSVSEADRMGLKNWGMFPVGPEAHSLIYDSHMSAVSNRLSGRRRDQGMTFHQKSSCLTMLYYNIVNISDLNN